MGPPGVGLDKLKRAGIDSSAIDVELFLKLIPPFPQNSFPSQTFFILEDDKKINFQRSRSVVFASQEV